jgi:hypothetical protein
MVYGATAHEVVGSSGINGNFAGIGLVSGEE